MHLEHDLAIRQLAVRILSDDIGIGVGDGWRSIVLDAPVVIDEVSRGRAAVRRIGEKMGVLNILLDVKALDNDATQTVFRTMGLAAEVCELCGGIGSVRRTGWHRVRCDDCENEELRRRRFAQEYRKDIEEEAAYYIAVCLEHARLFPVENIMLKAFPDVGERRYFIDEVHERLVWWRAGSWIEGIDEALRDNFRSLRFE